jgi:peptidylprolyl isomerase
VQDNYVVQWGDASEKKALPMGLVTVGETQYTIHPTKFDIPTWWAGGRRHTFDSIFGQDKLPNSPYSYEMADPFADQFSFVASMAIGVKTVRRTIGNDFHFSPTEAWLVHCYGMVGVGRNLSPDTGTGAELYTVIGHAPRHLDRNIALVGRVIEGIAHLSSLPRGTGDLSVYETPEERTPILSVRMGGDVAGLATYEYLSTESESFAKYADARANRRDPFFIKPAGGADICNIPVPVRRRAR